jgi:hypothetical protein
MADCPRFASTVRQECALLPYTPESRNDLDIVAIHQGQSAFSIEPNQLLHVVRIDPPVVSIWLPGWSGVVPEFLLLNPDNGLGEEIDPAHVIPVGVTDHHVGNLFGLDSSQPHSFVGWQIVFDRKLLKPAVAMKAAIEKNIAAGAADQPHDGDGIDLFILGGTHDKVRDGIAGRVSKEYRLDGVFRIGGRGHQGAKQRRKQESLDNGSS